MNPDEIINSMESTEDEIGRAAEFALAAPQIATLALRRRIIGPTNPDGLFPEILTAGFDVLGRELNHGEAYAVYNSLLAAVHTMSK